jgi:hypothetical protein
MQPRNVAARAARQSGGHRPNKDSEIRREMNRLVGAH